MTLAYLTPDQPQERQLTRGIEDAESDGLCWYAARVGSRSEFRAVDDLIGEGLDAYAPWETVRCENPRRPWLTKFRKFPLIAGYVFVRLDPNGPRTDVVEGVQGVKMLRCANGDLCRLFGTELDRIRWHQIRGLYDHTTGNNASVKRKAKKALREAVDQARIGRLNPRGARPVSAVKIPEAAGRTHPFGPTYRVASK